MSRADASVVIEMAVGSEEVKMYWGGVYWMFIIVAFVFRKDNMGHRLWKRRCTRKFGFADGKWNDERHYLSPTLGS